MVGGPKENTDDALMLGLACGATVANAARRAGISPATAYRRLAEPGFQAELRKLRSDMVERTGAMLTAASLESVKTLMDLQNGTVSASVRLGAARAVLELGMKYRETVEIEQRLAAIEERVHKRGGYRCA